MPYVFRDGDKEKLSKNSVLQDRLYNLLKQHAATILRTTVEIKTVRDEYRMAFSEKLIRTTPTVEQKAGYVTIAISALTELADEDVAQDWSGNLMLAETAEKISHTLLMGLITSSYHILAGSWPGDEKRAADGIIRSSTKY